MNKKNKLIIMGVSLAIIILVFLANIIIQVKKDRQDNEDNIESKLIEENIISQAEAYRLFSYLEYDRAARNALPMDITYADQGMSAWYDTYVNAIFKMGLISEIIAISPKEALTYGQCKEVTDKLILTNPIYQDIYQALTFDFVKGEEKMLIEDFIQLYEEILSRVPEEDKIIDDELLFVLGKDPSANSKSRIVTDYGKYFYQDAMDYELVFNKVETESKAKEFHKHLHDYYDKGVQALTCGDEIIYIYSVNTDKMVLRNVWIKQGIDNNVDTFINGMDKSFQSKSSLSTDIEAVVGDISIEDSKVVQISVKPDTIHGKVLQTGKEFIEVEGYGKLSLDEEFKIYKLYGELSMEPTGSILVGYENTTFVVSEGLISAALIEESIKAENIRVLLNTTGYNGYYHKRVEFTADTDFTITIKDEEKSYSAGEIIEVTAEDELLSQGRIIIESSSESGRIHLLSIERSSGNQKYRGRVEVSLGDNGLLVVNELPLEEYLYAVVPSEMPTYYGLEPLKAQAVCARSYAYGHLLANSLSGYGAHVDDSVSYQVYNNIPENEESVLAVKDTYGKVIEYKGNVINAYYFSTSCGHTTAVEHVWSGGKETPYLSGRLLSADGDSEDAISQSAHEKKYNNLSKEENFRSFILDTDYNTYDKEFNWYRWNVSIDLEQIKKTLDQKLASRYKANPKLIQTLVSGSIAKDDAVFESKAVETVGDIVDISILKRGSGGIITELLIEGTKETIKVMTEYNVRLFMSPGDARLYRMDKSGVDNLSLLPSAFFVIDKEMENDELKSFALTGGGYGHGVGMSQNGAKGMADLGKEYDQIIAFFYQGTELGFIYE